MSRFTKLFAAKEFQAAIAAAGLCSAALALSASAAADPVVTPAVPAIPPALGMIQQLAANPASMGAVLQSAAGALGGASNLVGAPAPATLPVSPIVGAQAPATLPVSPIVGAQAPATLPVSPIVGAPAAPVGAPGGPTTGVVPLLSSLGVPAQLANLAPAEILPSLLNNTLGIAQAAPAAAAPLTAPAAALPAAAAALPAAAVSAPLSFLNALP